ncbi:hypothetical protein JKP88DRAFT_232138, partial [Tribonema minus]
MMKCVLSLLCLALLSICCSTVSAWPGGKKEDEPKMPKGKDAVDLGMAGLGQLSRDPALMRQLMQDMNDPEIMAEVEKMTKDKKFQKEMNNLMNDDTFKNAMKEAADMINDPSTVNEINKMAGQYAQQMAKVQAAGGGNTMQQAMNMMGNPKMAAQLEQMMRDPKFQEQMKAMMDQPEFAAQVQQAAKEVEALMADPAKKAELERHARTIAGM